MDVSSSGNSLQAWNYMGGSVFIQDSPGNPRGLPFAAVADADQNAVSQTWVFSPSVSLSNTFTFAAWIWYGDQIPTYNATLFAVNIPANDGSLGGEAVLSISGFWDASADTPSRAYGFNSPNAVIDPLPYWQWAHFAFVRNDTSAAFYLNGQPN